MPRTRGDKPRPTAARARLRGPPARDPPHALPAKVWRIGTARGVFYEVLTRGFLRLQRRRHRGLAGCGPSSDYLECLGVDCLWLCRSSPSPMRDGGYDISDFFTVHAELGFLDDLVTFLDDAIAAASG